MAHHPEGVPTGTPPEAQPTLHVAMLERLAVHRGEHGPALAA